MQNLLIQLASFRRRLRSKFVVVNSLSQGPPIGASSVEHSFRRQLRSPARQSLNRLAPALETLGSCSISKWAVSPRPPPRLVNLELVSEGVNLGLIMSHCLAKTGGASLRQDCRCSLVAAASVGTLSQRLNILLSGVASAALLCIVAFESVS